MKRIIITTRWTDGDVLPFIRTGRALKKNGYDVVVLTHCVYESMIKDAGLEFCPIDTYEQYSSMMMDMLGGIDSMNHTDDIDDYRSKYENNDLRYIEFQTICRYCDDKDNTLIISKNRSETSSLLVSEKFGIPCLQVFMAPYELISMVNFKMFYGEKALNELNILRQRTGLQSVENWLEFNKSLDHNIGLWPEWFANMDTIWGKRLMYAGFPWQEKNAEGDPEHKIQELNAFIEKYKEVVLITGGTSKMLRPDFYSSCINAMYENDRPAIVLTKYRELLPEKLPDNIIYFDHLPLDSVMSSFSAIIHHGGIGTVCGALAKGIPQIILGHYVDRPYNGSIMKELGIAEYLPPARWNSDSINRAVDRAVSADKRRLISEYAEKCRTDNAFENIIGAVKSIFDQKPDNVLK